MTMGKGNDNQELSINRIVRKFEDIFKNIRECSDKKYVYERIQAFIEIMKCKLVGT